MDFFGIGTGELLVILLIAVIFLGPERMVVLARDLGRGIRQLRKLIAEIDRETPPELKEVREAVSDLRNAGNELGTQIRKQLIEPPAASGPPGPKPPPGTTSRAAASAGDQVVLPGPPPPTPEEPEASQAETTTPPAPPPEVGP